LGRKFNEVYANQCVLVHLAMG